MKRLQQLRASWGIWPGTITQEEYIHMTEPGIDYVHIHLEVTLCKVRKQVTAPTRKDDRDYYPPGPQGRRGRRIAGRQAPVASHPTMPAHNTERRSPATPRATRGRRAKRGEPTTPRMLGRTSRAAPVQCALKDLLTKRDTEAMCRRTDQTHPATDASSQSDRCRYRKAPGAWWRLFRQRYVALCFLLGLFRHPEGLRRSMLYSHRFTFASQEPRSLGVHIELWMSPSRRHAECRKTSEGDVEKGGPSPRSCANTPGDVEAPSSCRAQRRSQHGGADGSIAISEFGGCFRDFLAEV